MGSFNGRTGTVLLLSADVTSALAFTPYDAANPSGYQTVAQVSTSISAALVPYATKASPTFTGIPAVPTAAPGTNTTQAASTAYVVAAVVASTTGVSSFNARTGAVTLTSGDVTTALTFTPANIASPTFTGVPAAPTAAVDTNTTQLATTAYVVAQAASATPIVDGSATAGLSTRYARGDHVHPTDTSRAALASPTFTGTPAAPTVAATAAAGTTQLATTAFVRNGTTTNDDALAGQVGEYVSAAAAPVSVSSGTPGNITSISLTAGDWEISGTVTWQASGGSVMTTVALSINTVSATLGGAESILQTTFTANGVAMLWAGPSRFSLSGTTTIYLVELVGFTGGAVNANGTIAARRIR